MSFIIKENVIDVTAHVSDVTITNDLRLSVKFKTINIHSDIAKKITSGEYRIKITTVEKYDDIECSNNQLINLFRNNTTKCFIKKSNSCPWFFTLQIILVEKEIILR